MTFDLDSALFNLPRLEKGVGFHLAAEKFSGRFDTGEGAGGCFPLTPQALQQKGGGAWSNRDAAPAPPPEGTDGGGWPDAPEMIQRSYRRCGSWKESNCRTKSWTWDFRSAPTSIVIVSLSSQPTCTEVLAHGQSSSNSVLRGMCLGMCILIHPLGDSCGLKSKNSISASVAFNPFWPYFSSRPHTHLTKVS